MNSLIIKKEEKFSFKIYAFMSFNQPHNAYKSAHHED